MNKQTDQCIFQNTNHSEWAAHLKTHIRDLDRAGLIHSHFLHAFRVHSSHDEEDGNNHNNNNHNNTYSENGHHCIEKGISNIVVGITFFRHRHMFDGRNIVYGLASEYRWLFTVKTNTLLLFYPNHSSLGSERINIIDCARQITSSYSISLEPYAILTNCFVSFEPQFSTIVLI